MNDFYVYIHQRNDTGKCFYVGKGRGNRYKDKQYRNQYWNNIVNKVGFSPQILINGLNEELAFKLEKDVIKQIGIENLVNMTEGGEGCSGMRHSEETKQKLKIFNLGKKLSEETKQKLSESKKGKPSNTKGKKFSEKTRQKMSESKKGELNYLYNKNISEETRKKISESMKGMISKNRKKIIINNITYQSLTEASNMLNIPVSTISQRLKSKYFINYQYL